MTEEEAKTKWCPFVRAVLPGTNLPAGNRGVAQDGTEGLKGARCIASDCMAWRWTAEPVEGLPVGRYHAAIERVIGDGYCGLAGSPS